MRGMPRRETRQDIERALCEQPSKLRIGSGPLDAAAIAMARQKLEGLRDSVDPARLARMEALLRLAAHRLGIESRKRRRPGDGSMPALVEPPRGPTPSAGGAAAPLEFD